jgi:hypothetical protein
VTLAWIGTSVLFSIFFSISGPQIRGDMGGYSGIPRDTAGYGGYSRIQRDTAGYYKLYSRARVGALPSQPLIDR